MELFSKLKKTIKLYPKTFLLLTFLIVWAACSYVFYLRFPNNLQFPNFFAEDGEIFTQNILDKGFLGALLTPFNGYFIFGIYILTGIGFIISEVFFGNSFISLPAAFAVTSYLFLGLCCALPILLARKYLRVAYLIPVAFVIALLPMPTVDYVTIGTIGNLKFAFAFIAFLLVIYRINLPRTSRKFILIDALLLLCAFTTIGAYFVLPFLLLTDGTKVKQLFLKSNRKETFKRTNIALWSMLGLAVGSIIQLVYILINGIPKFPNYLAEPYQIGKTIEVIFARPFLYPIVADGYHQLTNLAVVLIFLILIVATFVFAQKKNRPIYFMGAFLIATITILFISNRTGVTVHYNDYLTSGFDNFFYAQNFIAVIVLALLLSDLSRYAKKFALGIFVAVLAIIAASYIHENNSYAPNEFMQYNIGSIYEQADQKCKDTSKDPVTFSIYPFTFLGMVTERSNLCEGTSSKYPSRAQTYGLQVSDPQAVLNVGPGESTFTQTFVADSNKLEAIALYLSTYYKDEVNNYTISVMDSACATVIRSVKVSGSMNDNSYHTFSFASIPDSQSKTYCFSIKPNANTSQPLALQLSEPDIYKEGNLRIGNDISDKDVVFQVLYQ